MTTESIIKFAELCGYKQLEWNLLKRGQHLINAENISDRILKLMAWEWMEKYTNSTLPICIDCTTKGHIVQCGFSVAKHSAEGETLLEAIINLALEVGK